MARHRIGLSEAWDVRAADTVSPVWIRRFGRPNGLEAADQVLLVIERAVVGSRLRLNGTPLADLPPRIGRHEWDVTQLLEQRNELELMPELGGESSAEPDVGTLEPPPGRADRRPLPASHGVVALEIVVADDDGVIA